MMYNYKETIASTYLSPQLCIEAFVYNERERCLAANCGNTHKNNVSLYSYVYEKKTYFTKKIDNYSSRPVIKQAYFIWH